MILIQEPNSYFTCEVPNGESTVTFEDCYFRHTYGWVRGGKGGYKIAPYLKFVELVHKEDAITYFNICLGKINITDIYTYKNGQRISVMELVNSIPKIDVYEE